MSTDDHRPAPATDGPRVLIVEDDYFTADDLAKGFARAGVTIQGPVPSFARATAAIEQGRIDGAVLDINLDGEMVFALADVLVERGVPLVFVSGYEASFVPPRFRELPFCRKPVDADRVIVALRLAGVPVR